jgi:hypothetical protein
MWARWAATLLLPLLSVAREASASLGGQERYARGGLGRGGDDDSFAWAEELCAQRDEILSLCMYDI